MVIVTNGTEFRGVITDWGGVLTTPILATVQAWIQADGIDWNSYRAVMRAWVADAYDLSGSPNPIHALERGECSGAEFEQMLAAQLFRVDGGAVAAEGLLQRMFAASLPVAAMYDTIRALRGAGLRTALLSNSWGCDEYPRADFPGLFDTVVISGEVGMRKPEEGIFLHAAQAPGVPITTGLACETWRTIRIRPARAGRRTCGPTGGWTPSPSWRCGTPCTGSAIATARISGSTWTAAGGSGRTSRSPRGRWPSSWTAASGTPARSTGPSRGRTSGTGAR